MPRDYVRRTSQGAKKRSGTRNNKPLKKNKSVVSKKQKKKKTNRSFLWYRVGLLFFLLVIIVFALYALWQHSFSASQMIKPGPIIVRPKPVMIKKMEHKMMLPPKPEFVFSNAVPVSLASQAYYLLRFGEVGSQEELSVLTSALEALGAKFQVSTTENYQGKTFDLTAGPFKNEGNALIIQKKLQHKKIYTILENRGNT